MTTADKLNLIEGRIKEPDFIKIRSLGNEVPFYIFDYNPQDEFQVREHLKALEQKINNENGNIKIKIIDLFDVLVNCLKDKGYLDRAIDLEKRYGSEKFIDTIKNSLGLKTENNVFVKKIVEQVVKVATDSPVHVECGRKMGRLIFLIYLQEVFMHQMMEALH